VSSSRELVKLYYRIGEVSQIVGVQPHVLRYWETEFRTIRPQKSHKGQRVYSRKDVEKLLKVKDLLKTQGFTIAGARKKLREPGPELGRPVEPAMEREEERAATLPAAQAAAVAVADTAAASARESRARMREALVSIRDDIVGMLDGIDVPPRRPKLPTMP
jgi:DNA-binding transcriptional MerR regulator